MDSAEVLIIGGGFYGCRIALELKRHGMRVTVIEREKTLLSRASRNNQARVHNGYHYPMSITTALRSRVNFPQFLGEYDECVDRSFEKYYAVASAQSDVTATQFAEFCRKIEAPLKPAPENIRKLFNPDLIEEVFTVQEYAFDAEKLAARLEAQMREAGIGIEFGCEALRLGAEKGGIRVSCMAGGVETELHAPHVLNCTYANINKLLHASSLPPVPLKMELTEMALVEVPDEFRKTGITVMAGPFFSFMPFPPSGGLHTLSHVRYTPHSHWTDGEETYVDVDAYFAAADKTSNYGKMIDDVTRFIPSMAATVRKDSLWEIKTTLLASEIDKSRPILFLEDYGIPGLSCIMGGKIDNIYDIIKRLKKSPAYSR